MSESGGRRSEALRIGFVAGVTVTKWRRIWDDRFSSPLDVVEVDEARQVEALRQGEVELCFVRLPIDRDGLHAIPLYDEVVVAWVAKEHPVAAFDEITTSDLTDETLLTRFDPVAVDRVLAGCVLVVPMSIARSASRRDLVHRPIADADPSTVALAWRIDNENPLIDEFIGVVRGRTPNSSRSARERTAKGVAPQEPPPQQRRSRTRRTR